MAINSYRDDEYMKNTDKKKIMMRTCIFGKAILYLKAQ